MLRCRIPWSSSRCRPRSRPRRPARTGGSRGGTTTPAPSWCAACSACCGLPSPRWWHGDCREQPTRTVGPLAAVLPERTTPGAGLPAGPLRRAGPLRPAPRCWCAVPVPRPSQGQQLAPATWRTGPVLPGTGRGHPRVGGVVLERIFFTVSLISAVQPISALQRVVGVCRYPGSRAARLRRRRPVGSVQRLAGGCG